MKPTVIKVRPKDDGSFVVCCPSCDTFWNLSADKLMALGWDGQQEFKLRCSCSYALNIFLELRKIIRKNTRLNGYFERLVFLEPQDPPPKYDHHKGTNCRIENLTRNGAGIITFFPHRLAKGDTIIIQFTLDNKKKTEVIKKMIVRRIEGNYVGCEFTDLPEEDKEFNFYLFND